MTPRPKSKIINCVLRIIIDKETHVIDILSIIDPMF